MHQVGNSTGRVSGKITLDKPKILCLTIPYSKGWTAYVDGNRTKIYQANSMYIGLPLDAGTHEIVLTYKTPGSQMGTGISEIGAAVCIMLFIARRKKAADAKASKDKK